MDSPQCQCYGAGAELSRNTALTVMQVLEWHIIMGALLNAGTAIA